MSVAEAIAIAKGLAGAAQSVTVYYNRPVYVKGYVVNVSSQTEFDIADAIGGTATLQFYRGEKDEGVTETIYLNDEVLLYGYIANYSNGYKSELAKNNDVTPLVKSVKTADVSICQETSSDYTITFTPANGKNGEVVTFTIEVNVANKEVKTVNVTNGEATYNDTNNNYQVTLNGNMIVTVELKDAGSKEEQVTIDLSVASNTGISSTANTSVATKTINGVECSYLNCKQYSGYLMLCKAVTSGTTVPSGYITGHVDGTIKKITITIGSGASAKTSYLVVFGTSAFDDTATGTAEVLAPSTVKAYTNTVENASYFCIAVRNANNGQLVSIVIDYERA